MNQDKNSSLFACRSYGKTELAHLYCPLLTESGARKKLFNWIDSMPGLDSRLRQLGYTKQIRVLTPAMVNAIVEVIGEPN